MDFIYSFTVALFLTIALVPPLIRAAPALGLMDLPDARKVHARAIPRSGGLAIALGVLGSLVLVVRIPLVAPWSGMLLGAAVIVFFGLLDDRRNLSYQWKFAGQVIAVLLAMYGGAIIDRCPLMGLDTAPVWITWPLTFGFLLGATNAVNLSDGLDGLAAGTIVLALAALGVLALLSGQWLHLLMAVTLIGGVLGFLRYNTHPAQVFMGDAGSQFLGFMTAVLAVLIVQSPEVPVSPVLPLLVLGLPILDTLMVMVVRIARGRSPFQPDRNHIHHQLIDLGFRHYEAVAVIYVLQLIIIGLGFLLRYEHDAILLAAYGAFAGTVLAALMLGRFSGWQLRPETEDPLRERRNRLLRKLGWFYHYSPHVIQLLAAGFFIIVALLLRPLQGDNLLLAWGLAPLLVIFLLASRRWPAWMTRFTCYSTAVLLSYLLSRDALIAAWLPWLHGYLVVMVIVLALAIRMTRREQFRLDTQDLLILLLILCVPLLPLENGLGGGLGGQSVGEVALRLAVLMYSCEFLIGRTGGRGLLPLSCAAASSVLLLAVFH